MRVSCIAFRESHSTLVYFEDVIKYTMNNSGSNMCTQLATDIRIVCIIMMHILRFVTHKIDAVKAFLNACIFFYEFHDNYQWITCNY